MKACRSICITVALLTLTMLTTCNKKNEESDFYGFKADNYIYPVDNIIKYSAPAGDSAVVFSSGNGGARLGIYLKDTHWPTSDGTYTYQMGVDDADINFALFANALSDTYLYYTLNKSLSRASVSLTVKNGKWKLQVPQVGIVAPNGDTRTIALWFQY